jgi:hypothetical protein
MHPPFTAEQFFDVFRRYNETVWPSQIALIAIAAITTFAAWRANARRSWPPAQAAFILLSSLWLWTGIAYHKGFFISIAHNAGEIFGSLFIAQAAIFVLCAWQNGSIFERASRPAFVTGMILIAYALVAYPAIGVALGHRYPASPTFGAPCPTTIFTFGIFCLLPVSVPRFAMAIPVLWAFIASFAALDFGMREDFALPIAAVAAIVVIHHETHRFPHVHPWTMRYKRL